MLQIKFSSKYYPVNLKQLNDAPEKLFINGKVLPADLKAIAVVGSRLASSEAVEATKIFTTEFVKSGYTIISGLARGIDTVAHQTALKNGGRTIAVLANGINVVYPPENADLMRKISKNGAVVTEFEKGSRPVPKNFLTRNRLVSGLSKAVLIVEASRRSGTLSTAAHAARQGREVFVLPFGDGAKFLIANGATAVDNPQQIIDYLKNL